MDAIVGIHGAQLTHAVWLRPQSLIVELLPWVMDGLIVGGWTKDVTQRKYLQYCIALKCFLILIALLLLLLLLLYSKYNTTQYNTIQYSYAVKSYSYRTLMQPSYSRLLFCFSIAITSHHIPSQLRHLGLFLIILIWFMLDFHLMLVVHHILTAFKKVLLLLRVRILLRIRIRIRILLRILPPAIIVIIVNQNQNRNHCPV